MSTKFTELHCKEVICVSDGRRLGFISDVCVEIPTGNIASVIVPGPCRFFGLLGPVFLCYALGFLMSLILPERGLAATLSEKSRLLGEEPVKNTAIVIGNEANGVSKEVCSLCDGEIIIPMRGGCESLNAAVAASIFMWEMAK